MTCGEVVDPTAAPLDYTYDDLADPLVAAPLAEPPATISTTEDDVVPEPELLATSDMSVKLGTGVSRVVIATRAAPDAMPLTAGRRGDSRKVLLNLENLTATSPAPAYDVYLGIPENGDPRSFATRFAGRISTFGIVEASTADERRSGSGLSVAIDVTRIVEQLNATPGWDASKLSVSFVPTKQSAAAEVIVGRVSLYSE
jgi:hypothetical protein